jgi:uncharacterized RDD family membrane protein YckC
MPHRDPHEGDEPSLFDLPLAPPSRDKPKGRLDLPEASAAPPRPRPELPLRPTPAPAPVRRAATREEPAAASGSTPGSAVSTGSPGSPGADTARLRSRVAAGVADLVVHAALGVTAIAGSALLGVRPQTDQAPPVALFVLTFSFVYTVIPLAFWGQTLGMVWAGLVAQNRDGEPLTFDQSARRWFGQLLTLFTAGLPLIATGNGRSVADLLSGSETHQAG